MNLRYSVASNFLVRTSGGLPRPFQGWFRAPQPCEVEGGGSQSQFDRNFCQIPTPELSHSALFFQDPEDRFDQRFSSPVDGASGRTAACYSRSTRR